MVYFSCVESKKTKYQQIVAGQVRENMAKPSFVSLSQNLQV